jgi:hypothetical protein
VAVGVEVEVGAIVDTRVGDGVAVDVGTGEGLGTCVVEAAIAVSSVLTFASTIAPRSGVADAVALGEPFD